MKKPLFVLIGAALFFAPFHKDFDANFNNSNAKYLSIIAGAVILAKGIASDD